MEGGRVRIAGVPPCACPPSAGRVLMGQGRASDLVNSRDRDQQSGEAQQRSYPSKDREASLGPVPIVGRGRVGTDAGDRVVKCP